ncbi:putative MFS-type transporter [Candidatus Syntrophocurvum alkaliphilum]|uniref:Putative MFS-type transporter n=1 Tax=Candidatus Syntrophocurvum alkaliphilum TaxID=2293317 RepID=A0A6I6DAR4_9FIRM|nr:MFS transporter [Candidatus Syntrophocurvum alkaliphilum]QGT98614.1 putative MFS-type transporter [Candidatus Syntrophocurvum alkaliphilum]
MKADSKLKVGILSLSNFITVLVNTILFPVFPAMARDLDVSLTDLAILVGIVSFPAAIVNLFGGILADRFGKKLVMVVSLIIYGLGGLLAGLAILFMDDPYTMILIGRFFQGLGSATPMFLSIALVGDIFKSIERTKAVGFLETANGLGKVSSPVIGGAIGLISWSAIFFVYPLVAVPVALATWIYIKEPEQDKEVDWQKHKEAFLLFKNGSRMLSLISAFIVIFILIGTMFWMSDFLAAKLDINKLLRGAIIALPAVAMMLTALMAGIISKKLHPQIIITTGLFIMAASAITLGFTANTLLFWPLILLIGIGAGTTLPAIGTVSTSVQDKHIRGLTTTIYGSARSLGAALSPITFSFLLHYGLKVTFITIGIAGIIFAVIFYFIFKEKDVLPDELLPENSAE